MRVPMRVLVLLTVSVLLAGCSTGQQSSDGPVDVDSAVSSPAFALPVPQVGLAGSGELIAPDGIVSGTVEIDWDGEAYIADLVDYRPAPGERVMLVFTDALLAPGDCVWEQYQIAFEIDDAGDWEGPLSGGMPVGEVGDPTFLSTAVIVVYGPVYDAAPACGERSLAWAALEWDVPTPSPGIAVVDGGEREGARGAVTLAGGQPASYSTSQGDNLAAIAERFGVSIEALQYLNPHRPWAEADRSLAYAEEALNLSQSLR